MKKCLFVILVLISSISTGFSQDCETIFTAASSISRPITIKTSDGTYTLHDKVRIAKHISWFEAYDGNGNKIMPPSAKTQNQSKNGKSYSKIEYHFTTLYPNSQSSQNKSNNTSNSRRERAEARRGNNSSSYEGNYFNPPYYSNLDEYIMWKMPKPKTSVPITNPQQYCGKWADKYILENVDSDGWKVDISWDGNQFQFSFQPVASVDYELVKQENDNNWLFVTYSYTDNTPDLRKKNYTHYYDDCDSNADPGFPRNGTYNYDASSNRLYTRITLENGSPIIRSVLWHTEYYYHGNTSYCHTEAISENTLGTPIKLVRFTSYAENIANSGEHEYVDLGLSVLWATCNIGASKEYEIGDYFAWAETKPKNNYWWSHLKYWISGIYPYYDAVIFSKYVLNSYNGRVDNLSRLQEEDDAAVVNWKYGWRMPTYPEMMELITNCKWSLNNDETGYIVTGPNGNTIFLPLTGFKSSDDGISYEKDSRGYYWTSDLFSKDACAGNALIIKTEDVSFRIWGVDRYYGCPIRPVKDK